MASASGFSTRRILPGLGSVRIISLYESRSGVLWIGTAGGGLIRLDNGVATTYTERDGLPSGFINSIRGDAEGNVWINTSGGIARFAGAKLEAYPTHRGKAVREFYLQARDGSMWFRSGEEVVRFGADGSIATLNVRKPSVFLVHEARDGSVWIGVRDEYRLVRYSQGVFSDVPLPPVGRRALTAWASRVSPHHGGGYGWGIAADHPGRTRSDRGREAQSSRSTTACLRMAANCPRYAASWWIAKATCGLE